MDNKKVEQVLKEIFDRCGTEIVQKRKVFMSAVYDLLQEEWKYKDERTVLKLAMESSAIPILLSASSITSDSAERAVEQIRKDMHMDSEDAKFVVQCVVAACGYNPDIVAENEKRRQKEAEQIQREEEQKRRDMELKRREEELRCREEEQKRREEELKRREEERKRREEEQKHQEEERKRREIEQRRQEEERKRREIEQRRQEEERKRREIEQRRQEEERRLREEEQRHQEEERRRKEEQSNQARNESITNFIVQACQKVNIKNSSWVIVGNPINILPTKYKNIKKNFNIPDNEEIFLIYDFTQALLGSCKKGIVLCTSGIYSHYSKHRYTSCSWEQLKTLDVYTRFYFSKEDNATIGGVMIGKEPFSVTSFSIQIAMVLAGIQENLRGRCQNINYEELVTQACNKYTGGLKDSIIWYPKMPTLNPKIGYLKDELERNYNELAREGVKEKIVCLLKKNFCNIALSTSGIHISDHNYGEWIYTYIPWETIISTGISVKADNQIMIGNIAFSIPSVFPACDIEYILRFIKDSCPRMLKSI